MDRDRNNNVDNLDGDQDADAPQWPMLLLALWLVVLGMLVFIVPMLIIASGIRNEVARVQGDINFVQQTVVALDTPPADALALIARRDAARANAAALQEAYQQVLGSYIDWPEVVRAIENYAATSLKLHAVEQAGRQITLWGRAADDASVVDYARRLEASGLFSRVVVRSIRAIEEPFATGAPPAAEGTPTGEPTATPTPDLRDAYELDDFEPSELFLNTPQEHTFYPDYDVDTLRFLAKAGRYYQLYTYDLAQGVDTFLAATVGDASYTSDDRGTGDLSSEIVFMGGSAYDSDALITVTNRGQYGPDKAYKITVKEVVPTATLIPTNTGIPSATTVPTATNTPTSTSVPTVTITPTPDLADSFEPDDSQPSFIAVGGSQSHTFYPFNDVDKVKFLAKAGRSYKVSTSNLAIGVDTLLFVIVGGNAYTNDDRVAGDPSSEVVFTVYEGYDIETMVDILNRGQYAAGMSYQIAVEEVVIPPTATAVPPSATPDLRDAYEPDESVPVFFAVGGSQSHTFYPTGDVDQVAFLAKANRFYYVQTTNLSLGVDTILTAVVPGLASPLVNDDRQPNNPSSALTIAVGASDVTVVVTVSNRGSYGPNAAYLLSIQEVIITPVPTATPDNLGDAYEPDDTIPKAIAVGDTQTHTFYPYGDVDLLAFLGKAGRTYSVTTLNLALGVDTVVTANVNGVIHSNDDRSGAPAGDYASYLELTIGAGADVVVGLTIQNKGLYGTDKTYAIRVAELTAHSVAPRPLVASARAPGHAAMLPLRARAVLPQTTPGAASLRQQAQTIDPPVGSAVEFVIVLDVAAQITATPTPAAATPTAVVPAATAVPAAGATP